MKILRYLLIVAIVVVDVIIVAINVVATIITVIFSTIIVVMATLTGSIALILQYHPQTKNVQNIMQCVLMQKIYLPHPKL